MCHRYLFVSDLNGSCGGYMDAESGAFSSPGYPYITYDYNMCTWLIEVPFGYAVLLTLNYFETEAGYDEIIVFNGTTTQNVISRYSLFIYLFILRVFEIVTSLVFEIIFIY